MINIYTKKKKIWKLKFIAIYPFIGIHVIKRRAIRLQPRPPSAGEQGLCRYWAPGLFPGLPPTPRLPRGDSHALWASGAHIISRSNRLLANVFLITDALFYFYLLLYFTFKYVHGDFVIRNHPRIGDSWHKCENRAYLMVKILHNFS